jgi:hypothetical protein
VAADTAAVAAAGDTFVGPASDLKNCCEGSVTKTVAAFIWPAKATSTNANCGIMAFASDPSPFRVELVCQLYTISDLAQS